MMLMHANGTLRQVNRLADETSPYLRQHRDNPVDWYPWGDDAFAAARERNVPILLSIGYSSCHWCHVMAHECFEDDEVATKMNELYVNVKVDREERPDVDQLHMDAVQALTGKGGWPLTVFLTPDAKPFFGGTYYPKPSFLHLLDVVDDAFRTKPDEIAENTAQLVTAISATERLSPADDLPSVDKLNSSVQTLARAFDPEWGGFGKPPKFPSSFHLELMLRAYMTSASEAARTIITTTLDSMAAGGMYDHIGGGFARYSTDREWLVPHFEKLLSDQALITQTYLHALVVLRQPQWRAVVQDTIEYVLNTMTHEEGGFYSAEDADSPGPADSGDIEGLFYTWVPAEVRAALPRVKPEIIEQALDWWDITDEGHFDTPVGRRSIPNRVQHRDDLVRSDEITFVRQRLQAARAQRARPRLDDKVVLEWNALFMSTLAQAGAAFNHQPWLDAAEKNAEFLIDNMRGMNGRWYRTWHAAGNPPARNDALAADHAALVDGFTRLAEATGRARWIEEARATADTMLDWFFDPSDGGLYTNAEDGEHLIVRLKDVADNSVPSANSLGATALYRLAALTGELRYANHADRILHLLAAQLGDTVGPYSNALLATDLSRRGTTEIVIVGGVDEDGVEHDMSEFVRIAKSVWRPDSVLAWGEPYESPLWESRRAGYAYVCRDHECSAPASTLDEFIQALTGQKPATANSPDG
jgi:uncharacterized protein YyaL (SSP411 family)